MHRKQGSRPPPPGADPGIEGGGAKVKYVQAQKFHPWPCQLWCIKGYAKLGGGKLGEALSRSRLHTGGLGEGCVSSARSAGRKILLITPIAFNIRNG